MPLDGCYVTGYLPIDFWPSHPEILMTVPSGHLSLIRNIHVQSRVGKFVMSQPVPLDLRI